MKTEPAKQRKVRKNQKWPLWPKVRQINYKNGTKAWLVDGRIMRNRMTFGTRYFFRMKAQAETKADQLRTLRRSEGASALSLSAADRIDAEAALSLLAPHHRRLREAAEFFIKHLGIVQGAKTVSEVVDELVENKLRDGASHRYVKDLRSRLNIFAASFQETNVTDLSAAAIDDWLRDLPHGATTRNNYRRLLSVLFAMVFGAATVLKTRPKGPAEPG